MMNTDTNKQRGNDCLLWLSASPYASRKDIYASRKKIEERSRKLRKQSSQEHLFLLGGMGHTAAS